VQGGVAHAADTAGAKDRIAQYFGLFALTGKVTSFVGPLLIGIITAVTASQKPAWRCCTVLCGGGWRYLEEWGIDRSSGERRTHTPCPLVRVLR